MNKFLINYLPRYFSNTAIFAFILVLLMCSVIFMGHTMPLLWVVFAFIEFVGFFLLTSKFTLSWSKISNKSFRKKLFGTALILRLIWVVFSYFFFIAQTGEAFDFVKADSYSYHTYAVEASGRFWQHGLDMFFMPGVGVSDQGFPLFLTFIYLIFGDALIIPRIIFALLSAWTCVFVYKLASRNFGESSGRIAGIMTALLPNLIYYTGLHLKETLMVFLIVAFIERADYLMRTNKITIFSLFIIALLSASMFMLRTVLAVSAIFALFSALVLSRKVKVSWANRIFASMWFLVIIYIFLAVEIQGEIEYYIQEQDSQEAGMQYRADREGGNKFATYGSAVVFLPVIVIAPFPTFVDIDYQKQQMLLSGSYFIRNIFAFFVILALIFMIRKKLLRNHILILTFVFSYFFILAKSSFALSERFHQPIVPFLLILAGYGITLINKNNKKFFLPYIIFIIIIVIGWNWFKLAGRGAV